MLKNIGAATSSGREYAAAYPYSPELVTALTTFAKAANA